MLLKTLVVDGITPVGAYAALRKRAGDGSFLLESVVPGERWGRYSVLGYRPRRSIIVHPEAGVDPFAKLATFLPGSPKTTESVAERFYNAQVGVVNYDAIHYAVPVKPWENRDDPLARLVCEACVVVFDNLTHTATVAAPTQEDLEETLSDLAQARSLPPLSPPARDGVPSGIEVDTTDAEYSAAVERIKEYIRAGDAFQVVPSRTFSAPMGHASILDVYRSMRVLSPAPYMYIVELPATDDAPPVALAGASPETLVKVEANIIHVRPLAGTRPRGRTPEEDRALAAEMLSDPKEVAEHVMLIDLGRNDVGRVARSGSVVLPVRMEAERFSHVMHIVSEVRGELRDGYGPWDVLRACFPAGTLSGAPKVRAMQIIRELEKAPRGAYSGAVGYVTPGGDMDFAIAIRTVVQRGDRFEVRAGAGIVADSQPQLECDETRHKAAAGLAAVAAAHHAASGR